MVATGGVAPDLLRRDQPFVRVGGRHADVDDGDVGRIGCDKLQQLVGGAGLGGTSMPCSASSRARPSRMTTASSARITRTGSPR